MASTKIAQYTTEQTAQIVAEYAAGATVEMLAETLGKSVRSIVAKLSREGVYKAKKKAAKAGAAKDNKEELAQQIGALCSLEGVDMLSLAKANRVALAAVLAALKAE